jgi:hypothetical protein
MTPDMRRRKCIAVLGTRWLGRFWRGRKGRRPGIGAVDQVRVGHQSTDGEALSIEVPTLPALADEVIE